MKSYEYKVIAAPHQGRKAKGVKTTADRFALALSDLLNEMAGDNWEYVRAETLPCDERRGLTGTQTTFQNILVFRRSLVTAREEIDFDEIEAEKPLALERPRLVEVHNELEPEDDADADTPEEPLRATRETEGKSSRKLGPANADD